MFRGPALTYSLCMFMERCESSDTGYAGLRMSAEEFFALGETSERYELVNGVVVMSPGATPNHDRYSHGIQLQIEVFGLAETGGRGFQVHGPAVDLYIDDQTVYQPDIFVYAHPPTGPGPDRLTLPPDLIVEIASPGTKRFDLATKQIAYERFGVKEYWSVDPNDRRDGLRIQVWRLQGTSFVEPVSGLALASSAIPGFVLDIPRLLAKVRGEWPTVR